MPPHKRPGALEVSWGPQDDASTSRAPLTENSLSPRPSFAGSNKRRRLKDHKRPEKRHKPNNAPPVAFFRATTEEDPISESAMLDYFEVERESSSKPHFTLSDFSIFDASRRQEMVPPLVLRDGCRLEGVGFALPDQVYENEEDAGQEDDLDTGQYIKLGRILQSHFDFEEEEPSTWIETEYAYYILGAPSQQYREIFRFFINPRFHAQRIIASAQENCNWQRGNLLDYFLGQSDPFGRQVKDDDFSNAEAFIPDALKELKKHNALGNLKSTFLKDLLTQPGTHDTPTQARPWKAPELQKIGQSSRNLDLAVHRRPNQTHVTGRIGELAVGLVGEALKVVGPRPPPLDLKLKEGLRKLAYEQLRKAVIRAHSKPIIQWRRDRLIRGHRTFLPSVIIDQEEYKPGDVILVPIGQMETERREGQAQNHSTPFPQPSQLPQDGCVADYFWFAKIIFIDIASEIVHVQWFNHGFNTVLGRLAHPQELFLQELCGPVSFGSISGKVIVHQVAQEEQWSSIPSDEYFYKLMYNPVDASFTSPDRDRIKTAESRRPPDNCPVCLLLAKERELQIPQPLTETVDGLDRLIGVSYRGECWHLHDFVLYQNFVKGPADIGYVVGLQQKDLAVTIRKVGRVSDIGCLPKSYFRDERALYLTTETEILPVDNVIRAIFVVPRSALKAGHGRNDKDLREKWVSKSPYHFYVKYEFRKMTVIRSMWKQRKPINHSQLMICISCYEAEQKRLQEREEYLKFARKHPLRTLDLCGGVGAFSIGLAEGSGLCLKITHTVEISPSAAKTFKLNSPETIVTNQCLNLYLKYAIKSRSGEVLEVDKPCDIPSSHSKKGTPIPEPPKPGDIKVIVAGFPCQTHSALNMYKRSDDPKSNLLLTTLSEVDRLRPDYCFFENVPGFLFHQLRATQVSPHKVQDGIEQGGLQLLERAMLDLGYQTRFCILEAGHYGTPQTRVRFFMIAAKLGLMLPSLPQPTHDFPSGKRLNIQLSNGTTISPIRSCRGTAAHKFISVKDATEDLPLWDWKHPEPRLLPTKEKDILRTREKEVLSVPYAGIPHPAWGADLVHDYSTNPTTRYQVEARSRETPDLQHFTKQVLAKVAERVHCVPLKADADYRSIGSELGQFQMHNPDSAMAKRGNRPGAYGRLDAEGYFNTTVTNVDPTAKQCKILHPSCHRILTVRELARSQGFPDWFQFFALDENVITHRHIGNAVPWPVARAIGRCFQDALFETWKRERIVVD
ncbi:hypothetical protein VKT23_005287 [Stygiomarasmius scandens]|uniref:DNA (cytosine-5-)-methyltransferase n=1 Tax=Marasmiellus scandens TaxID=2682957 RepID=A0ABR1JPL7_9AGAR